MVNYFKINSYLTRIFY